jgi:dTDP-4-amino-4,6-dideoxygalactose transaminase
MTYFFPSILSKKDIENQPANLAFTVNSGEKAIRLLLRSMGLQKKSKIAIPIHVCDALKNAVLIEGFEPYYLDLKNDGSFWANYDIKTLKSSEIDAVILVHLYGFIHPDTNELMNYCQKLNIPLIHDAAQSYGIDEKKLNYGFGIVYSFGPGKSTTAAGGAVVKGLKNEFYTNQTTPEKDLSIQTVQSKLFFKSRIYGYSFSLKEKIMKFIFSRINPSKEIRTMTSFQKKAALAAIKQIETKKEKRIKNYFFLKTELLKNSFIQLSYDYQEGLFFKMILTVKSDPKNLKSYLEKNQVPYFCLFDSLFIHKELFGKFNYFIHNSPALIELSTEASIPFEEIERVAKIIKDYNPESHSN